MCVICIVFSNLQAVQSHLYDDYAALYYLLLNKWEHGQLQVTNVSPVPPKVFSRISGKVPAINVNRSDSSQFPTGNFQDKWQRMSDRDATMSVMDPNLVRYLKLGRRHTLGAAHNHMLMPPNDLGHLHEASECSSQTSDDSHVESRTVEPQVTEPLNLRGALTSGNVDSLPLQSSGSPLSRASLIQPHLRARMGRRASDGGPYAAAFRLYLEKRTPQLAQINSRGSLYESGAHSSTSSVKQLLLDKRGQEQEHITQSKEFLQYKEQVYISRQIYIFFVLYKFLYDFLLKSD